MNVIGEFLFCYKQASANVFIKECVHSGIFKKRNHKKRTVLKTPLLIIMMYYDLYDLHSNVWNAAFSAFKLCYLFVELTLHSYGMCLYSKKNCPDSHNVFVFYWKHVYLRKCRFFWMRFRRQFVKFPADTNTCSALYMK